jgi:hypothetical protein
MNSTSRKGAILAITMVAVASLAACQAGQSAATSQDYQPVDGRNINVPEDANYDEPYVAVRNAVVVAYKTDATLVVTIVNQSPEAEVFESATLDGLPVTLSGGPIELAPKQSVSLGYNDFETATVSGFKSVPGDWVDLTMRFTSKGDAKLQVLVVPYGDEYVPVQFAAGVVLPETVSQ